MYINNYIAWLCMYTVHVYCYRTLKRYILIIVFPSMISKHDRRIHLELFVNEDVKQCHPRKETEQIATVAIHRAMMVVPLSLVSQLQSVDLHILESNNGKHGQHGTFGQTSIFSSNFGTEMGLVYPRFLIELNCYHILQGVRLTFIYIYLHLPTTFIPS